MDYLNIFKQAWKTIWNYKTLWVFGLILAITTAGGGMVNGGPGGGSGRGSDGHHEYTYDRQEHGPLFNQFGEFEGFESFKDFEHFSGMPFPETFPFNTVLTIIIIVAVAVLLLSVISAFARYVSETSLIGMVDEYDDSGEKRSFRQGLRLGWSRSAWRLFLINVLLSLPTIVYLAILGLIGLMVYSGVTSGQTGLIVTYAVSGGLLFLLSTFLLVIYSIAVKILRQFFWRSIVLEEVGVRQALRMGYALVRQNLKDTLIIVLMMFGLRFAWAIALIPISILLFPAFLGTLFTGLLAGGIPGALLGGAGTLAFGLPVGITLGALLGLPLFFIVAFSPWILLEGLMAAYSSSVWTLTYREMIARQAAPELLPEPDIPVVE
jgi:hypothetical protein